MKSKFAVILAVVAGMFAAPQVASSHYIMHSYEAQAAGYNVAYNDCLYRGNPPWSCFTFPLYGPNVWAASDHTWAVQIGYVQATSWGARRQCNIQVNYTHGVLTNHYISAGC